VAKIILFAEPDMAETEWSPSDRIFKVRKLLKIVYDMGCAPLTLTRFGWRDLLIEQGEIYFIKVAVKGVVMIYFVMLLKPVAWLFAFWTVTRTDLTGMLLRAAGITAFLTVADYLSVASNLQLPAILLTLVLYALMSFILMPLAWKLKNIWVSIICNVMGVLGALAGVNFTMDFLRGLLPFMAQ
jgi:hypothetical protein